MTESQDEALAFMQGQLSRDGARMERVETHLSVLLLGENLALKLKRSVRLPFVDFTQVEHRLAICERELALNRRTAPRLYRAVRRITRRADGGLELDGGGPLVECYVEMLRFKDADLFAKMAAADRLTPILMDRLAKQIAAFHAGAEAGPTTGGADRLRRILDLSRKGLSEIAFFAPADCAALLTRWQRHRETLDARAGQGKVRRCHGDLHLGNICLFEGQPTLFDCLEFDEELATVDVLYDLAFLLMDLWHRGHDRLANLCLNRYLDATGDEAGLALLPFFMALRAAIRAQVLALQAKGASGPAAAEARAYFALAGRLLDAGAPRLVAVGGLSGSGKSTLAGLLAPQIGPPPGARVLSSDRLRKGHFGVAAETRLPEAAYASEVSQKIYHELMTRAALLLQGGWSVVADAVFDRPADRAAIASAAPDGVRFSGLWLQAPAELLAERVSARRDDPSDATVAVVEAQSRRLEGEIGWPAIPAGGDVEEVLTAARSRLGLTPASPGGAA
jgi:aminoglycoside phosphotransferase family enzyme/predicted kinase